MKKIFFLTGFVFMFLYCFHSFAQNSSDELQDYQTAPGTNVKIIPPRNFQPHLSVKGFMHAGSSASIQVQEIAKPFKSIIAEINDATFTSQGYTIIKQESVKTNTLKDAMLYHVSFKTKDVEYERLMLLTGDEKNTVWINANYPKITDFLLFDVLKKSLLSVIF